MIFYVDVFRESQTLGIVPKVSKKASSTKGGASRPPFAGLFFDFWYNSKSLRLTKKINPGNQGFDKLAETDGKQASKDGVRAREARRSPVLLMRLVFHHFVPVWQTLD